jgi:L-alanine-DL-glutamate epimerase-like enolase superfamily enzyme
VIPYRLPFREPYVTARGRLDGRDMVLLRILTDDGTEGLGEAVPLSLRGGDDLAIVAGELDAWGRAARGIGPEAAGLPGSAPARCAVLTALADAAARDAGVPLHALLLPGSVARPIRCNATLSSGEPGSVAAEALRWAADGFEDFKLKVGPGSGARQVAAVREAVGERARIRVDANATWPEAEAARFVAELGSLGVELVEEPVGGLLAMASLKRSTRVPLVADESVTDAPHAAEAARVGACDAVTVKLSKTGSLDATLGGALPTYLSSALDGPVGIAAAAHVAMTLPRSGPFSDTAQGLATSKLFDGSVAIADAPLEGPWLGVPAGPGLGIELDRKALREHRL